MEWRVKEHKGEFTLSPFAGTNTPVGRKTEREWERTLEMTDISWKTLRVFRDSLGEAMKGQHS